MNKGPALGAQPRAAKDDTSLTTDSPQETRPLNDDAPRRTLDYGDMPTLKVTAAQAQAQKVRYRVIRPHAEGGLGRVFVAYDAEVGREVALKEIKVERSDDFDSRDRFTREAEITGNLEHPGIVPVYGQGSYPDGRPYYAMRFIRGITLKEAIDAYHRQANESPIEDANVSCTFDLRRLLKRLIDVCQTMQYAHSRGVLHRDLKPGNIMLGPYGETLVVDWGLAKASGEASVHLAVDLENSISKSTLPEIPVMPMSHESQPTQLGDAVGTPAYMSPEQAQGRVDLLCPASDVFSLGAILFQILTGQPPYRASSTQELLRLAREGRHNRPRAIVPSIPRPLEAICLKAIAPDMTRRYASAAQLARDLDCFLADEPVSAHRPTMIERLARWIRRHKTTAGAIAVSSLVVFAAAVIIAVISVIYGTHLETANRELVVAKQDAEAGKKKAEDASAEARRAQFEANRKTDFIMSFFRGNPKATIDEALKEYLAEQTRIRASQSSEQTPAIEPSP